MTNTSKVQKLAITAFVAVVMVFLFLNLFTVQAHAAGLLDETIDTAHEFSRYPIDNYQLDFYVDSSWDWLPWNWLDGIGKTAQYAIYLFTNFLWTLNLYISNAVGYLIQQAYDLDFISSAASEIGKNIQLIAGVSINNICCAGKNRSLYAVSKSSVDIPIGAMIYNDPAVYHSRTTDSYCGLNAGHVGIYIGNGQIASNIGGTVIDTVEGWTAYYGFGGWGWGGAVVAQK